MDKSITRRRKNAESAEGIGINSEEFYGCRLIYWAIKNRHIPINIKATLTIN